MRCVGGDVCSGIAACSRTTERIQRGLLECLEDWVDLDAIVSGGLRDTEVPAA